MKKYLLLSVFISIVILFFGCQNTQDIKKINDEHRNDQKTQKQTILKIKNESSQSFFKIRCNEQSFGNDITASGNSVSKEYDEKIEGYIYFDIVWKDAEKTTDFQVTSVRTNEIIIIEKGQEKTFIITDNTLIVPVGKQYPVSLISLKPAFLYINDTTSGSIEIVPYSIQYAGNICKRIYARDGKLEWFIRCDEDSEDYIGLTVKFEGLGNLFNAKMLTKTSIKKGESKTITITDGSEVFPAEGFICTISQLQYLFKLTITNSSQVQLQRIRFGKKIYDGQLKPGEKCTLALITGYEELKGNCEIVIDDKIYYVEFYNALHVWPNGSENFVITDNTEIVYNGTFYKIKDMPS